MQLLPGAEPFRLVGGPAGVLLLHGFASSPFELRYLAERLQAAGYTGVCPLLPGHGTDLEFFSRATQRDWLATAEQALLRLTAESAGGRVRVVGQSLGALLGLQLAATRPDAIAALACLATPLLFTPLSQLAVAAYRFSPLRLLEPVIPRPGGADIQELRLRRGLPGYDRIPLRAAAQFRELQQQVIGLLPRVRAPLLALHGEQDHTVPVRSMDRLLASVASTPRRAELLPESYHVLSLDVEKSRVAQLVIDFFKDFA